MQCRTHVAQLGRLYPDLQAASAEVLVILGDSLEHAKRYGSSLHVPFPILADPDHTVYHQFDLHRAMLVIQRTASVVVDRDGIVRYIKRAINPMTWLQESQELLEAVRQLASTAGA
jgi:peroxiredoxin